MSQHQMTSVQYAQFSHAVRALAHDRTLKEVASLFDITTLWGEGFVLKSPASPWNQVVVTFSKVKDHPEWMRLSSSNWRYEDELNGVYTIEDARRIWRTLAASGFAAF